MARPRGPSPVELANTKVSITYACRLIGMDVPEDIAYGRSMKVYCPFGPIAHADGGAEPAMRIYPEDNHAWCFAGCGFFTPVWLVAQAFGQSSHTAALDLLERAGVKPVSVADAWAAAMHCDDAPDRAMLAVALTTFCARIDPDWSGDQFHTRIASTLRSCLTLLDHVRDSHDAQLWLASCKTVMARVLDNRQDMILS